MKGRGKRMTLIKKPKKDFRYWGESDTSDSSMSMGSGSATPSSLTHNRISIKKAKMFHFFGTELESKAKIKQYI